MKISDALKLFPEDQPVPVVSTVEIITTANIDEVLKYFKAARPGYFNVTADQVAKIKASWHLLHDFDPDHDYTFNDSFTIIRKSKL
jgi:hypothetical protein